MALVFPSNDCAARFIRRGIEAGFEIVALDDDLTGWLKARRPAILHVHAGIGWEGHELVEAGWNAGIPIVRTEHLPYLLTDTKQKSRHRLAANLAETLVVVSDAAAESYRAEGFARIVTIRNGIEAPVARRARVEMRAALVTSLRGARWRLRWRVSPHRRGTIACFVQQQKRRNRCRISFSFW